jgi:hypothetical protein
MSLISQCVSPLDTPGLREALLFGGDRADWERVFDLAATFRVDDAVLRVREQEARREELRREQERKLIRCAPAPCAASIGRPHIFRALYSKDIGGVPGASDVWFDAGFAATDGLKTQALLDYVDSSHLWSQGGGSNQAAAPAVDAAVNNAPTIAFTAAGSHRYDSSRGAAATFGWFHDGTNAHVYLVLVPTSTAGAQFYVGNTASNTVRGFYIWHNTTSLQNAVGRAGGALYGPTTAGTIANGAPVVTHFHHGTGRSPQYRVKMTGQVEQSGPYALTPPDSSGPTATLRLGGGVNNANHADMRFAAFYALRNLSAAGEAVMASWISKSFNLAV